VPARVDSFGQDITRVTSANTPIKDAMATGFRMSMPGLAGTKAPDFLAKMAAVPGTPLAASKARMDPVYLALEEAGIDPSTAVVSINGEALGTEQKDEAARIAGPWARERIERVIKRPDWWLYDKDRRAKILEDIMDTARERARNQMQRRAASLE
jgi:hypothetical protein